MGSFDLDSCIIDPAGKQDTKRKHVFIISTPKKVKLYIQTTSDKEFSAWLDAIMRELIARKEGQNQDTGTSEDRPRFLFAASYIHGLPS